MKQLPNPSFYGSTTSTILIHCLAIATICCTTIASLTTWRVDAFQQHQQVPVTNTKLLYTNSCSNYCDDDDVRRCRRTTFLYMAAGSRSLNKQAALRQKLEQAKLQNFEQQQQQDTTITSLTSSSSSKTGYPLSEKEIRERNDRLRFEELLQKKGGAFIDSENDMEYKTRQQEDDEIDAVRK
jgi:hypothetical protein